MRKGSDCGSPSLEDLASALVSTLRWGKRNLRTRTRNEPVGADVVVALAAASAIRQSVRLEHARSCLLIRTHGRLRERRTTLPLSRAYRLNWVWSPPRTVAPVRHDAVKP